MGNKNSGRRPKPTHLRVVTGNPGKRPLNQREAAPRPAPKLPDPPAELNADAQAEWKRVSRDLYDCGLLKGVDRIALAAYCQAVGRWQQAERALAEMAKNDPLTGGLLIKTSNGNAIQNPIVGIANKAMADMVRYCIEFGMTPSARSRIEATAPIEETDPAAKYFG
jgi:P27 family predicted phage terminase small subunit